MRPSFLPLKKKEENNRFSDLLEVVLAIGELLEEREASVRTAVRPGDPTEDAPRRGVERC